MAGSFRTGGLASGLDTNSIVDSLVSIERRSVDLVKAQQDGYRAQMSAIGTLVSKLQSLNTAAQGLTTGGVLGVGQVGTTSGFTATPTSASTAGRYSVLVENMATAAKARSSAFTDAFQPVTGGTLRLGVNGTDYDIAITDGASLTDVAKAINDSDAPVSAALLTTNGQTFLSLTRQDTGFTVGQPAASALTITETSTGALGQPLGLAITQAAENASVVVDGLRFERSSNTLTDVLPGTTLNLSKETTTAEDLVLTNNADSTKGNLQKFVDAYNELTKEIRRHLNVSPSADRSRTLSGDGSLRSLQSALQGLITSQANPTSSVRTLADLGIKTQTDGTLSIDATKLSKAIGSDAAAVNALFANATTGLGAATKALEKSYNDTATGVFTARKQGLERSVKNADTQIQSLELRLSAYQDRLIAQFTAMEKIVGGFKSVANFLTLQEQKKES